MHWVRKEGVKDLLESLKNNQFSIGLISNFNYREAIAILSNLKILDFFDVIHISEKEGFEKPDIEFYNLFFAKNNLSMDDCLYFGDSYTLDLIPSKEIDLSFVLLDELNLYKMFLIRLIVYIKFLIFY